MKLFLRFGSLSLALAGLSSSLWAAPQIRSIQVHDRVSNAAMVVVETASPGFVQVEYGLTAAYGSVAGGHQMGHGSMTRHMQQLAGLQPGTQYHFRVRASDTMDMANPALSADQTLTTFPGDSGDCDGRTNAAFCDTFDAPHPGGRGGDLNEARWGFSRMTSGNNPTQGTAIKWPSATVQFCRDTRTNVFADNDSFFCGTEFNESHHWMEAFDDQGDYMYNSAMIKQPFDFTGRTGTVFFDLDAKHSLGHGWWTEFWLTDEPLPAPHFGIAVEAAPRNGLRIRFNLHCGEMVGPGSLVNGNGMGNFLVIRNYVGGDHVEDPFTNEGCISTANDAPNRIEIRVNTNRIEVWASDASPDHAITIPNFRRIGFADNINLPFSKGFVHFQHSQYNAGKEDNTSFMTYHWDNMGFDGPKHPMNRSYEVPNSPTKSDGVANLGYIIDDTRMRNTEGDTVPPFVLKNVNIAGAQEALLLLNEIFYGDDTSIRYRFNNGTWRTYVSPAGTPNRGDVIRVPMSDLKNGDNTLEFRTSWLSIIGNIDLQLVLGSQTVDATPPSAPASVSISSRTATALTFTWPAASDNVGVTGYFLDVALNSAFTSFAPGFQNRSIGLNTAFAAAGLTPGTTYFARVRAVDAANNVSPNSPAATGVTPAGTPSGLTISAISVANVTQTGAVIAFNTSQAATAMVDYGPTTAYGQMADQPAAATNHSVALSGLTPGQTYHFRVMAMAGAQNAFSADQTFTTPGASAGTIGDMNGDGLVNLTDLSMLLVAWNTVDPRAAWGGTGPVGVTHLSLLLSHWNSAPASPQAFGAPSMASSRLTAGLKLVERGRKSAADPIAVDVFLDSPQPVNAVQAAVLFPPDKVALAGVDESASAFPVAARKDEESGALTLARGSKTPLSGRLKVATLLFNSLVPASQNNTEPGHGHGAPGAAKADVFTLAFSRSSLALKAADAANVLVKAEGLEISSRLASPALLSPGTADGVNDRIIFDPDIVQIAIVDANGRKVYEAESLAGASLSWNGRDEKGRLAPSGLYIAKVRKINGETTYQKIVLAK